MLILTLNCGSSSLKLDVLEVTGGVAAAPIKIASGQIDRVAHDNATATFTHGDIHLKRPARAPDHAAAVEVALSLLREAGLLPRIDAVGHRVVHGGARFRAATRIDEAVIAAIDAVSELAPLHNAPALGAIRAARDQLGPTVPMVAAFDTTLYADLPEVAATYALPLDLAARLGLRRYGFHGLAHAHMIRQYRDRHPGVAHPRLTTLQLGNGCSVTASVDGRPIDTSMGFTPLEGLVMGTRSGDLDPAIPLYIAEREGLSPADVESLLNTRSGLLGVSGRSSDMRDLLAAAKDGDSASELAISLFCYRAKKYLGAYYAALGGCDAVIFGGGIGENSPEVRARILDGLECLGLALDPTRNAAAAHEGGLITTAGSSTEAWVLPVDESLVIATEVAGVVAK